MADALIFPNQSLFMVDRGWQRRKKTTLTTLPLREKDVNPQPLLVPEITITVAKVSTRSSNSNCSSARLAKTKEVKTSAKRTSKQFHQGRIISYEPRTKESKQPLGAQCSHQKGIPHMDRMTTNAARSESEEDRQNSFNLKRTLPGTATALYSIIDPEVIAFQKFVSYYPTRMATSMYPISKGVRLKYNPIETIWYPAVLTDEVSLHTILFSCAMHFCLGSGQSTFKDSDLLMKIILDRLNRRVHRGDYSDLTIGGISCLALCQNQLGNHETWGMHAAGMSEMIRARGGFDAVRDVLHMKIYRADIIGAVDTMLRPYLPRPRRKTETVYSMISISHPRSIEVLLADISLSSAVSGALTDLESLCHALNHAVDKQISIDPFAFDEDVVCIQHDLLRSLNPEQDSFERLVVLTSLIFIQMLTREVPFTRVCSGRLSKAVKEALLAISVAIVPSPLVFWMLFMGGLVSTATSEKGWFRTRLQEFQLLGNSSFRWENISAQLQEVFWVDSVQGPFGLSLWQEVKTFST